MEHLVDSKKEIRLDSYLALKNISTSRSDSARLIKDGFVKLNDQICLKPATKVIEGDRLDCRKPSLKILDLAPIDLNLEVIFEDQHLLVINKPAGLVVHPGAGHYEESLVHGLLHHCKNLSGIGGVERPGIVHRLDKGTSGLMVVAKTDRAHQHLSQQFQNKKVQKVYAAICVGVIQKDEQRLENLMKRAETNRKKFVVNQKKGKLAISNVSVVARGKYFTLVHVSIETGRTHQIRVHLRHLGHPIVGDEMYGGRKKPSSLKDEVWQSVKSLSRPLLHAGILCFDHPVTGERLQFTKNPPSDFNQFLSENISTEVQLFSV